MVWVVMSLHVQMKPRHGIKRLLETLCKFKDDERIMNAIGQILHCSWSRIVH
jgi:hypothetical protein